MVEHFGSTQLCHFAHDGILDSIVTELYPLVAEGEERGESMKTSRYCPDPLVPTHHQFTQFCQAMDVLGKPVQLVITDFQSLQLRVQETRWVLLFRRRGRAIRRPY